MITITDLVDNQPGEGFAAEHGLSLWIEAGEHRILFDTGAGGVLTANAVRCGVDLGRCTGIFLSHGHYDHTGGLALLAPSVPIYAGRGITEPCFSRHEDGSMHDIGMPSASRTVFLRSDVRTISALTQIVDGIVSSGEIPRLSPDGNTGNFFCESSAQTQNPVPEEQAMFLPRENILITGCCHAGLVNTVEVFRRSLPGFSPRVIVGGLHLMHSGDADLARISDYLNSLGPARLILLHCTGVPAATYLRRHVRCEVTLGKSGDVWTL